MRFLQRYFPAVPEVWPLATAPASREIDPNDASAGILFMPTCVAEWALRHEVATRLAIERTRTQLFETIAHWHDFRFVTVGAKFSRSRRHAQLLAREVANQFAPTQLSPARLDKVEQALEGLSLPPHIAMDTALVLMVQHRTSRPIAREIGLAHLCPASRQLLYSIFPGITMPASVNVKVSCQNLSDC